MPATATGRGAQVIIDPGSDTERAIRGAYAPTLEGNLAKVRGDRLAGTLAYSDTTTDGTTATGGKANDLVTSTVTARIIGMSNAAVSHTGDTASFNFAVIPIPAGAMGPNGILRVTTLWSATGTNTKNVFVALSPVAGSGGTNMANQAMTTQLSLSDIRHIRNAGSTQSQKIAPGTQAAWGALANAVATSSINTDAQTYVNLNGTLTNAGESITLESYIVELLRVG